MSPYVTSLLRTLVPSAWGTALAWLVSAGVLDAAGALGAAPFGPSVLVPITIGAYYALVRLLERQPWWPRWLSAVLLGGPSAPSYGAPAPVEELEPVVRLHQDDLQVLAGVADGLRRLTPASAESVTTAMRTVDPMGGRQ